MRNLPKALDEGVTRSGGGRNRRGAIDAVGVRPPRRRSAVIVQEYIPDYRVALFERMREMGRDRGLDIDVAAGSPRRTQADRGDAAKPAWVLPVKQWEIAIRGRRITLRSLPAEVRHADLVVMEQARRNIDAYRLLVPRTMRKHGLALWGHGRDYIQQPSGLQRVLMAALTRRADWFFAYTEGGRRAAESAGRSAATISVLNNTVDTGALSDELASISDEQRAEFAATWYLRGSTALFLGGLDRDKRLPFLVEAADVAAAHDAAFRLLVAGGGVEEPWLRDQARTRPWLRLMGHIDGAQRALALDAADVICMPGRIGLVALDSFTSGVPIVTTDFHGHAPEAEYLKFGVTALRTSDDSHEYGEAVAALLMDGERLAVLAQACRDESQQYSIDSMADRFVNGITACLDARAG